MRHAAQATCIFLAIPAEEYLVFAEDARHAVDGNLVAVEHVDVVAPEFIFDEKHRLGTRQTHELAGVGRRVEGEVTHHIGHLVVLPHLIARGREESEENFGFGVFAAQAFHEGAPLFKLAERGGMKPIVFAVADFLAQDFPSLMMAAHHERHDVCAEHVEIDC